MSHVKVPVVTGVVVVLAVFVSSLAAFSAEAAFSGANGKIAYVVNLPPDPPAEEGLGAGLEITVADANGANARQITDNNLPDFAPTFSPDGNLIAYVNNDNPGSPSASQRIFLVRPDGSGRRLLRTGAGNGPVLESNPAFSRDGKRLFFTRYSESAEAWRLFSVRVEGGSVEERAHLPGEDVDRVVALPGGQVAWLARENPGCKYTAMEFPQCHAEVKVGRPDGSGKMQVTSLDETTLVYELDVTADGRNLLLSFFEAKPGGRGGLALVPYDEEKYPYPVTNLESFIQASTSLKDGFVMLFGTASPANSRTIFLSRRIVGQDPPVLHTMPAAGGEFDTWMELASGWNLIYNPASQTRMPLLYSDWAATPGKPKPSCRVSWVRARFFVFRWRPAIRLVARYRAKQSGRVRIRFFERGRHNRTGRMVGRMDARFSKTTRRVRKFGFIRVRRRVSHRLVHRYRSSKRGFVALLRVKNGSGYCHRTQRRRINLYQHRWVDRQHVWFEDGTFAPGQQPPR